MPSPHIPLTDLQKGLSPTEARSRLKTFGPNQFIQKKGYSNLKILFSQFASPLVYVLLFAGAVTIYLGEFIDTAVIFAVVLVNTLLGFYQERKAAAALEALKSFLKPQATVIRDGVHLKVPLAEVVPGDICLLGAGQSVPADGVVISQSELLVSEAILTGESKMVSKSALPNLSSTANFSDLEIPSPQSDQATNYLYMGTLAQTGVSRMLVIKTGSFSQIGKIAETLVTMEESETPLQEKLTKLSKNLSVLVVIITALVLSIGVWRGQEFSLMLETAVAIAVSAIPEGLVVALTVVLALGMQRIFKQKALVRKLVAAETLGSVSVICCDKTGTLTEGKLGVVEFLGERDELVRTAILANDEQNELGVAMSNWAQDQLKQGVSWSHELKSKDASTDVPTSDEIRQFYKRIDSIPFSSERKYMASLVQMASENKLFMVGAPEMLLEKSTLSKEKQEIIKAKIEKFAGQSYRMAGVASYSMEKTQKLTEQSISKVEWLGLLVFEDKIRAGVKEALHSAQEAGIDVKVITGDYAQTASAILNKLEITSSALQESQIMEGSELEKLSKEQLAKRLKHIVLFARTTPEQKLKIVEVLREQGEVVAMTGDGVNDALALKSADIGVVVNEASDVSKETADMVLLDSNFSSIVAAVREGRIMYDTIKKVITYLLTDVFSELILIGGTLLLGLPLPVTAVQILWINLIEDGLPGLALAFDKSDDGVMLDKPRSRHGSILNSEMKTLIWIIGAVNIFLIAIYVWLTSTAMPLTEIRTIIFVILASNSLLYVFSVKSLKKNIWHQNLRDNHFLIFSVIFSFLLLIASVYWRPIQALIGTVSLSVWVMVGLFAISVAHLLLVEAVKWWFIHKRQQ